MADGGEWTGLCGSGLGEAKGVWVLLMQLTVLLLCMCKQMVEQAESVRCGLVVQHGARG